MPPQGGPNGSPYMNGGTPPPGPQYNGQPSYGQDPRYAPGGPQGPMPPYGPMPPVKPNSNLVWGIITTVLCCLPFGIVSIVKACQVDNYWEQGNYIEAYKSSESAKKWAIISVVASVVAWLLYFLFIIGIIAVGASS